MAVNQSLTRIYRQQCNCFVFAVILFIVFIYFGDNDIKFSFYRHLFLFFLKHGPLKEVTASNLIKE